MMTIAINLDDDLIAQHPVHLSRPAQRPHHELCGRSEHRNPELRPAGTGGVRFVNAYAYTPFCSPFRVCLYTGQYITTHGVTRMHRPLLPRQPELAEVLLRHGYHISHVGKWHLSGGAGPSHFVSPCFRPGFQQWRRWENSNEPFATRPVISNSPRHGIHLPEAYSQAILTSDF